jgi:hypothetical protein
MSTWIRRIGPRAFAALLVLGLLVTAPGSGVTQDAAFLRGDSNLDGNFDVSDAIFTFRMIFLGDPSPGCDDAADVDDDGFLNITDGIYGMRFLFLDSPPPPAPFGTCGTDSTKIRSLAQPSPPVRPRPSA